MGAKKKRVEDLIPQIRTRKEKEFRELESRSKPLDELVVTESFTVEAVLSESYTTSFTPYSERIYGGQYPVYPGGLISRTILTVRPDKKDFPVRELIFDGYSTLRAGEYITAKIPRYEEKIVIYNPLLDSPSRQQSGNRIFYLDREFKPEESAIEIVILSDNGIILRTERATNYGMFKKRE